MATSRLPWWRLRLEAVATVMLSQIPTHRLGPALGLTELAQGLALRAALRLVQQVEPMEAAAWDVPLVQVLALVPLLTRPWRLLLPRTDPRWMVRPGWLALQQLRPALGAQGHWHRLA